MPSVRTYTYTEKSNKGGVVRAQLDSCASVSGHGLMLARDGHGRPALSTIVDPTKLKYLAVTVIMAASTVLAKSVRFLEHVSPGCCAGIAIVLVSWSA